MIESLRLQIGPNFDLLNATGNRRGANVEHRAMRDALSTGDGAAARRALQPDIEGAADILMRLLSAGKEGRRVSAVAGES